MKRIAILGATGSIGLSALDVVRNLPGEFQITAISGGSKWKELAAVAQEFRPALVAIADESRVGDLKKALVGLPCTVLGGSEGVVEAAAASGAEMLLSAAVGAAGLRPTFAALENGVDVALANKETLVMAGDLVMHTISQTGARLLPVDSEHSAVFQCMQCGRRDEIVRLVLTASGGPFRRKSRKSLGKVKAREALLHPTWEMGPKITVDSATLMNKALEVIEAHWLFGFEYEKIDVVVHPQSVVHSLVEYIDGSCIAQLGPQDMKLPIQYALTYPERKPCPSHAMDLTALGELTFEKPNRRNFPCLDLGYKAGRQGGLAPAVFSAANEAAVELFLEDEIPFNAIPDLIRIALRDHAEKETPSLDDILHIDGWARKCVREHAPEYRPEADDAEDANDREETLPTGEETGGETPARETTEE